LLFRYKTWIVSPEGVLNGLPLETLLTDDETTDFQGTPYLLRRVSVIYAHSATVWRIHRIRSAQRQAAYASKKKNRPTRLLALADPVSPDEAEWNREDPFELSLRSGLGRLPHTRSEAIGVLEQFLGIQVGNVRHADGWRLQVNGKTVDETRFPEVIQKAVDADQGMRHLRIQGPTTDLWFGAVASRQSLMAASLEAYKFLHISCHGYLDVLNPGLSGLILSPTGGDSGILRLMDLMNLKLDAEVVTLSGCKTAGGKPTAGEGFQGLVRAFLYAGAENVVAGAWPVPDAETAELLPEVYRRVVKREVSPVEALRQAKLRYLDQISTKEKAHPFYWGAWMLWGTGVAVADLDERRMKIK